MDGRLLGGRYRLLEAHAMGGMASVWRANDERTGEVVAIKRLHPHLVADESARERFRREAAAMEAVRHPNVVAVRDAVLDDDEPALVMAFIEGRSIAEMAADGRRFDEVEATGIAAAVADGLAAAHERGIVHRDVKPANVLVGDDGIVRISDFGIAASLADATALTADDGVIGTLRYLAPERLAGKPATAATDVWGLGTVLYEMLVGAPAFPATTLAARIESASTRVGRPDGLADATWAALARMLATDPHDRYPDGAVMSADLHRLPGVPPAAVAEPDDSSPTEVIAIPGAAASATAAAAAAPALADQGVPEDVAAVGAPHAPATDQAEEDLVAAPVVSPPVASGHAAATSRAARRRPSRSTVAVAAMLGALTLALVVGMAAGPGRGDPDAAAATSRPATATPKATPAQADEAPAEQPKPDKDEEKKDEDKGKGKGNGGDGGGGGGGDD